MNYAYGDELSIVPYVKNEIVAIAPKHDSPIICLNSPNYTISEKFALLRIILMGCVLLFHMIILMNIICMCLLLLLAIIMRELLHLRLFMFPTRKNCRKLLMLCIGLYLMCMNCSCMTCRCMERELDFVID